MLNGEEHRTNKQTKLEYDMLTAIIEEKRFNVVVVTRVCVETVL